MILLSDYGKGVRHRRGDRRLPRGRGQGGGKVVVDSKARSFARYGDVDLVKPNAAELAHATDLPTETDAEVEAALARALELWATKGVLVTRGLEGHVAGRARPSRCATSRPRRARCSTPPGAGDTALAALGLALAGGAAIEDAIAFAQLASGVAVGKAGTATVSPDELVEAAHLRPHGAGRGQGRHLQRMAEEVARWRAKGLRVGFTNGCFDILHKGHVAYLAQARAWCDRLIVGLNSDASVRALKGEGRPVNDLEMPRPGAGGPGRASTWWRRSTRRRRSS